MRAPDMTSGEETAAFSVTCSATELDVPFTAAGMLRKRDAGVDAGNAADAAEVVLGEAGFGIQPVVGVFRFP